MKSTAHCSSTSCNHSMSLSQDVPRRVYSNLKGGHDVHPPGNDRAKVCDCAPEDGTQMPGSKLIEAHCCVNFRRNQPPVDTGGFYA